MFALSHGSWLQLRSHCHLLPFLIVQVLLLLPAKAGRQAHAELRLSADTSHQLTKPEQVKGKDSDQRKGEDILHELEYAWNNDTHMLERRAACSSVEELSSQTVISRKSKLGDFTLGEVQRADCDLQLLVAVQREVLQVLHLQEHRGEPVSWKPSWLSQTKPVEVNAGWEGSLREARATLAVEHDHKVYKSATAKIIEGKAYKLVREDNDAVATDMWTDIPIGLFWHEYVATEKVWRDKEKRKVWLFEYIKPETQSKIDTMWDWVGFDPTKASPVLVGLGMAALGTTLGPAATVASATAGTAWALLGELGKLYKEHQTFKAMNFQRPCMAAIFINLAEWEHRLFVDDGQGIARKTCPDEGCPEGETCMRRGVFLCGDGECEPKCVPAALPDSGDKDSPSVCSVGTDCRSGICLFGGKLIGRCTYPSANAAGQEQEASTTSGDMTQAPSGNQREQPVPILGGAAGSAAGSAAGAVARKA